MKKIANALNSVGSKLEKRESMMKKNLEIYVHIPFCVKKCLYCDFLSFYAEEKTQQSYVEVLLEEIRHYGTEMEDYEVSTIYIGGGTPSYISHVWIQSVLATIRECFLVKENCEVSIECNPGTLTVGKLAAYKSAGVNRLSIGLQSASDEELKMLGRIHTYADFLKSYEMARNAGFDNINIDLISGLPKQTVRRFSETLEKVIPLHPEHISVYSLIIEKGTPFYDSYKFDMVKQQAGMKTDFLPSEDEEYRIYKLTQDYLGTQGYKQYEISNYALSGCECRHNIGYWTRENYLGVGLGAASLVDNVRSSNTRELAEYMRGNWRVEEEILTRKAQIEEFMFLGLRMNQGISRADFEANFGIAIEAIYREVLEELKSYDLLVARAGRIYLTEKGRDISNYCMSKFIFD